MVSELGSPVHFNHATMQDGEWRDTYAFDIQRKIKGYWLAREAKSSFYTYIKYAFISTIAYINQLKMQHAPNECVTLFHSCIGEI